MPHSFVELLDNLVKADLLNWRDMWFHCLLWSTAAVAIGLFLEGPELYFEMRHIWLDRRDRRMFFVHTSHEITPRWKVLAFVGRMLIALGVAGEGIFEAMVSRADGQVQTFNDILLTNAQVEAELAKSRSGEAYEQAAKTEKEAEGFRLQAETERLARVKIEAAVAWRSLDDKQKRTSAQHLPASEPKRERVFGMTHLQPRRRCLLTTLQKPCDQEV